MMSYVAERFLLWSYFGLDGNENIEKIIELLKNGANPLGSISNQDKYEYLYNELIVEES